MYCGLTFRSGAHQILGTRKVQFCYLYNISSEVRCRATESCRSIRPRDKPTRLENASSPEKVRSFYSKTKKLFYRKNVINFCDLFYHLQKLDRFIVIIKSNLSCVIAFCDIFSLSEKVGSFFSYNNKLKRNVLEL